MLTSLLTDETLMTSYGGSIDRDTFMIVYENGCLQLVLIRGECIKLTWFDVNFYTPTKCDSIPADYICSGIHCTCLEVLFS